MRTIKIIYWVSTVLISVLLLMSAGMYVFNHEEVVKAFESFGYPQYLIYPLAFAKITAVVVLLSQKKSTVKEWVYSALLFEFILAFFAHVMISDGEQMGAIIALTLLALSYFAGNKAFNLKNI